MRKWIFYCGMCSIYRGDRGGLSRKKTDNSIQKLRELRASTFEKPTKFAPRTKKRSSSSVNLPLLRNATANGLRMFINIRENHACTGIHESQHSFANSKWGALYAAQNDRSQETRMNQINEKYCEKIYLLMLKWRWTLLLNQCWW